MSAIHLKDNFLQELSITISNIIENMANILSHKDITKIFHKCKQNIEKNLCVHKL